MEEEEDDDDDILIFFKAHNLCYGWPLRRLASAPENLATPLVGSMNFLLITV